MVTELCFVFLEMFNKNSSMIKKESFVSLIFILSMVFISTGFIPDKASGQAVSVEVESGAVWFSRNDVRIPNDGGTKFDMINLIGIDAEAYFRLRLQAQFGDRHTIRLLYAPIQKQGMGFFSDPVTFENSIFEEIIPVNGTYVFNTYRLTYRYTFYERGRWALGAGAAALVRDAKVELVQRDMRETNTDVGFVPLLHFNANYRLYSDLAVVFDVESLAGVQGRATDASLHFDYRVSRNLRFLLGYRVLEGGADVEDVYNFSWINFGSIGLRLIL